MRARVRERTCDVIKGEWAEPRACLSWESKDCRGHTLHAFVAAPENAGLLACGRVKAEGRSGAG